MKAEEDNKPEISYEDLLHVGPGTVAGRYLRMFWQPLWRSQDLAPGQVAPVKLLGEKFALYRGEAGAAHLLASRCAHRGAPLYVGAVEDDALRCMYHGWKYDGASGQCVEQPGEEETLAFRVGVRNYPTHEYLGLIFVYLGEGEAPPFKHYADMDEPGVLEACLPEYWPCNYFNRIDNACDLAHVAFTHREALMRAKRPDRIGNPSIKAEETDYGVHMSCANPPQETHFHMPNTNLVRAHVRVEGSLEDAASLEVTRISWRVPVDDENTVSLSIDLTHVTGEDAEKYRERRKETEELAQALSPPAMGEAILAGKVREKDLDGRLSSAALFSVEDYLMQVGQGALDRSQDRLGRIDVGVLLARKIWQRELKAMAEGRPIKRWNSPGKIMSPVQRRK